ncbi:MAG TPA: hypothetical protein PLW44_17140 [Chitinophagales bacterium]|nr:hypothetical protein [Chitinophagales bacterium]
MKKLKSTLLFVTLLVSLCGNAQVHDPAYIDGLLYFKVKPTFSGVLSLQHPALLPLVGLYQMDTCYRPFMGLNSIHWSKPIACALPIQPKWSYAAIRYVPCLLLIM